MKQPVEITVCNLECLVMPNTDVISAGKTLGCFKDFEKHLEVKQAPEKPKQKGNNIMKNELYELGEQTAELLFNARQGYADEPLDGDEAESLIKGFAKRTNELNGNE